MDTSTSVDRVVPEHKLRCDAPRSDPGGGGINVARAARTLGSEPLAVWTRGGPPGEMLRQCLDAEGLHHREVPIGNRTRTNLTVYESTTGNQYRFGMPGPEMTRDESAACVDALGAVDPTPAYVVMSGSLPPGAGDDFYARALRHMPAGARAIVDTRGEALARALDVGVYLVKPNVGELRELVGDDLPDDPAVEGAARTLVDRGHAEVVVTSLGAAGAVMATAQGCTHIRAPTVAIRSKVGAGDSMVGGLVHALAQGEPLEHAVRFGIAAGAAAVMTPGTGLCRHADVQRLYASMQ